MHSTNLKFLLFFEYLAIVVSVSSFDDHFSLQYRRSNQLKPPAPPQTNGSAGGGGGRGNGKESKEGGRDRERRSSIDRPDGVRRRSSSASAGTSTPTK